MMPGENERPNFVEFPHSQRISVPVPEQDRAYAVRDFDWQRIKRRVKRLSEKDLDFSIWYPGLIGMGVSSGLSIVTVCNTKDLPNWVTVLYVLATFCFLFMGFMLRKIDSKARLDTQSDAKEVLSDMEAVESLFNDPQ